MPRALPKLQRVAAYALILRDDQILLTRLASRISADGKWHLPGGGLDHGENPRDALVREIREETGLDAEVGDTAHVYSAHLPSMWRQGRRWDYQALRIVYDAWVPADAPAPRVEEVDGSTVAAAWHPVADVLVGRPPGHRHRHRGARRPQLVPDAADRGLRPDPPRRRRSCSPGSPTRGFHSGSWTLPGGGLDHGESPREGLAREVREECGVDCEVGDLLDVHDLHFGGVAPSGRFEDFHGVHLLFRGHGRPTDAEPRVAEVDGTTDAVAWVPLAEIDDPGTRPVLDVVRAALAADPQGPAPRLAPVNPRHRRLVIPLALGGLLLIVVIASVVRR